MKKSKLYITCRKCGKKYHYSTDTCSNCELIPYWLSMAKYYDKQATEARATAKRLQEEKDREVEQNQIPAGEL